MRRCRTITYTIFLISLIFIIFFLLNSSKLIKSINGMEDVFRSSEVNLTQDYVVIYANELIADVTDEESMRYNTEYLQCLIDKISSIGGGTVKIPAGTFFFTSDNLSFLGIENYIIKCRDNVTIEGCGTNKSIGTILKPVGNFEYGINMFYYNEYDESNGSNTSFLENADFYNFIIDCENAVGSSYDSSGNGFKINLNKNCDWEFVTVKNADSSGFEIGNSINSNIINCIAQDCGKKATESDMGASGFEIYTGYDVESAIYIKECASLGNVKYGFYIENIESEIYTQRPKDGVVISNCISSNNLYDYGGINAYNVIIENSGSYGDYSGDYNKFGINFDETSKHIYIVNCLIEKEFSDVLDTELEYYNSIYWALNNGIAERENGDFFEPLKECTEEEIINYLWNFNSRRSEEDPIEWALNLSLIDNTNDINSICLVEDVINMIWRYAGKPSVEENSSDNSAVNWAINIGMLEENIVLDRNCTKADILTYLYKFSNYDNEFFIEYNLMGGFVEIDNSDNYIAGTDSFSLNNPIKTGYTFSGWSGSNCENVGNMDTSFTPEVNVEINESDVGNKVFIANWIPNTYTIKFDSNDGKGQMVNQEFVYNESQNLRLNQFTKDGYEFKEWNTKKDGTGESFSNVQMINNLTSENNEEIILYAQWDIADLENKKNIFIGDSLLDEMHKIIGGDDFWITERAADLNWLKENLNNLEIDLKDVNIIIGIGKEDLYNNYLQDGSVDIDYVIEKYKNYLNVEIIRLAGLGAKVHFVSVGPFDEEKIDNLNITNESANLFNSKILEEVNGMNYIDLFNEFLDEVNLEEIDYTQADGIHSVPVLYSMKYKMIKENLGQKYLATYEMLNNIVDCTQEEEFYEILKWGLENVYIDPILQTEFGVDKDILNHEVISLLWRYMDMPCVELNEINFTDVTENNLYYDAVIWGVKNEIIENDTNLFYPNTACTKGEFVNILWKLGGNEIVNTGNNFTDIDETSEYLNAINWSVNKGIIKESESNEFLPDSICTRKMAMTFLYNYHYRYANQYTVTYNYSKNGGSDVECAEQLFYYGDKIDLDVVASKPGYEFVGWNTDSDAMAGLTEIYMQGEEIVLYAIFKKDVNVIFIDYEGLEKNEIIKTITIYNNEVGSVDAIEINSYDDWNIEYWVYEDCTDISKIGILPGEKINNISENLNLYGVYSKDITIQFKLNGGKGNLPDDIKSIVYKNSENIDLIKESEIKIPTASLVKNNFEFVGWNTRTGGEGDDFNFNDLRNFSDDTILYAKWIAINEFPFEDISTDAWCYNAVKFVYNRGYILGFNNTQYGPGAKLTRGMIVTILNRMEGNNKVDGECKFLDVKKGEFYYESVKWACAMKIVNGYEDGTFHPNKEITREELAVILRNYTRYKDKDVNMTADLSKFNDGDMISDFALKSVEWAVAAGVITGYEDTNTIKPQGTATRDVVASMLYKYCKKYDSDI